MTTSKRFIAILILCLLGCFLGQTLFCETIAEPPSNYHEENAGSEDNPFLIANLANLRWLSETQSVWGSYRPNLTKSGYHFLQTADINASETRYWNGGRGFTPIGYQVMFSLGYFEKSFIGDYDGNHYKISNLFINAPKSDEDKLIHFGLFGTIVDSTIKNVRLENIQIATIIDDPNWFLSYIRGTLVGDAIWSTIKNCSATGQISSSEYENDNNVVYIGGLVGRVIDTYNEGLIENSYSTVSIYGNMNERTIIGGLVGAMGTGYTLKNSYFNGVIHGQKESSKYGGLVGVSQNANIQFCYVTSYSSNLEVNSLIGSAHPYGNESNVFTNNFWDEETTDIYKVIDFNDDPDVVMENNFGLTSSELKNAETFINNGWNFEEIWDIDPEINNGYPFLRSMPPPEDMTFAPPNNLVGNAIENRIELSWDAPSISNLGIFDAFNVYRDEILIHRTQNPYFSDGDVEMEKTYEYFVTASYVNPSGESTSSNILIASLNVSESDVNDDKLPLLLSIVYPNPVRGVDVTIKWDASLYKPIGDWHYEMGGAELTIYNVRGQLVKKSSDFETRDGENVFVWDRRNDFGEIVASGVYFYQIKIHNETLTGRMVLLK